MNSTNESAAVPHAPKPSQAGRSEARRTGVVHLVYGPQGAGKSTHANALAEQVQGVCFSIDAWMIGLFGPDLPRPLDLAWVMQRVRRCEDRIWETAASVARQGKDVVLDVGCMKAADRERFVSRAQNALLPIQTYFLTADRATRRERVILRNKRKGATFAFEVLPAMFDMMEGQFEAPSEQELADARVV